MPPTFDTTFITARVVGRLPRFYQANQTSLARTTLKDKTYFSDIPSKLATRAVVWQRSAHQPGGPPLRTTTAHPFASSPPGMSGILYTAPTHCLLILRIAAPIDDECINYSEAAVRVRENHASAYRENLVKPADVPEADFGIEN